MCEEIAKRHGAAGLIRLIADIAIRLPIEYLSEMRQDMRYASRALIKSPGFALVGIVSMGLGIGLTTNVYGSRWALLTRELPAAANAKRLVMAEKPVSYYYIEQYRDQKSLFAGVAALQNGVPFNVSLEAIRMRNRSASSGNSYHPIIFPCSASNPSVDDYSAPNLTSPATRPLS